MKVSEAMLCIDCDAVFRFGASNYCPVCGSVSILPLSLWVMPLGQVNPVQTGKTEMEARNGS
jgi:hypothetical protein